MVVVERPTGLVGGEWRGMGGDKKAWPPGGVLAPQWFVESWPPEKRRRLGGQVELTTQADTERVIEDLLNVRPADPRSLCEFESRWGPLGVGVPGPGGENFSHDGVVLAGKWVWHLTMVLIAKPTHRAAAWRAFQQDVPVPPQIGDLHLAFTSEGPRPLLFFSRLLDVILASLAMWSLDATPPRQCANPRCQRLMLNPSAGRQFCSGACGNRTRVQRSKKKKRALERLAQGEAISAVARRYGVPIADVRAWKNERQGGRRR